MLQPVHAQCLRLSEHFFHSFFYSVIVVQLTTDISISGRERLQLLFVSVVLKVIQTWAAQPGGVGDNVPPLLGPGG